MDNSNENHAGIDWRILFGLGVTSLWVFTGLYYLAAIVGWENFLRLPTADIGSFFEGAFAPLAFLWLVIGHFMQQKEITANTRAISMQEQSTRRLELHSRRDSYFKLLTLVQGQLSNIAAFHFISVFGPTGSEEVSLEEFSKMRAESETGDHSLFVRKMIAATADRRDDPQAVREMLLGTDVRVRHCENFKRTFKRLMDAAESVDQDGMVREALLDGSAAGLYYRIIQFVTGEEVMNPIFGSPAEFDQLKQAETAQAG